MTNLTIETEDAFTSLLELAANNDLDAFKRLVEREPSAIDEIGLWYGRKKGSNQMVLEQRTPLMVAATYGSLDVLNLIVSVSTADVNLCCGLDKTTALHCAASGGSVNAVDAVKILLSAGADPSCFDVNGRRPADVIVVSPKLPDVKTTLEELLGYATSNILAGGDNPNGANNNNNSHRHLRISTSTVSSNSPPLSSSSDDDLGLPSSDLVASPMSAAAAAGAKFQDLPPSSNPPQSEKKEYPIDPSLPDIKNSIYSTDEFRMYSFKVRPCSRAYSHDWTECPFVHPGENARRRDPRKYHYSCVPCPDFRKGACRRGDLCEYAHGVFECWLHPAQYRTRLCKDGTGCNRRVCFFAHTTDELRPLFVSTGSAVPSPRSSASAAAAAMEMAMSMLPGSPSSMSMMSPTPFTPPMSPSAPANGMSHNPMPWPQPNVPTLHLPGSNLQSSRLRTSLNARDIAVDEFALLQDLEAHQQLLNSDYAAAAAAAACFSPGHQTRLGPLNINGSARSKSMAPSNLDDLFCSEISSSPRFNSDQAGGVFSPSHKSATGMSPFQQQQAMLSPINTNVYSPKAAAAGMDPQQLTNNPSLLQATFGISSPGRMSPRGVEPPASPFGLRMSALGGGVAAAAAAGQREKQLQYSQMRSLSSRELGSGAASAIVGSPVNSPLSKWGSPSGKLEWSVNGEELGRLRRSNSFELLGNGEEPDVSWVQSLVKESPPEMKEKHQSVVANSPSNLGRGVMMDGGENSGSQADSIDQSVIGAWLEQMQLDQLAT